MVKDCESITPSSNRTIDKYFYFASFARLNIEGDDNP